MSKRTDALRQLFKRATTDAAFRAELVADPKRVMAEHGFALPDDTTVAVHENAPGAWHLVLPPLPGAAVPEGVDADLLVFLRQAEFGRVRESRFDRLGPLVPQDKPGAPIDTFTEGGI